LRAMVMQESERLVPRAACNAYRESSASNSANGQSSKSTSN
jgi:hypothetical protein